MCLVTHSFLLQSISLSVYLSIVYFLRERERESGRDRGRQNPKQAPICQRRDCCGAWSHEPWDLITCVETKSQMLNWLSHPGAPPAIYFSEAIDSEQDFLKLVIKVKTKPKWTFSDGEMLIFLMVAQDCYTYTPPAVSPTEVPSDSRLLLPLGAKPSYLGTHPSVGPGYSNLNGNHFGWFVKTSSL